MLNLPLTKDEIYSKAIELGWDDMGITSPSIPEEDINAYKKWIEKGNHADLKYMENDLRCYPDKALPGVQSVCIFVSYYKQEKVDFSDDYGVVASYSRGRDYHNVHHSRLKKFCKWLIERTGEKAEFKRFSDSFPLLERALAVQAGLGWFGKNNLLIHRKFGTFTLLSGLLTTLPLNKEVVYERLPRCGPCTKCIDACPTNALKPYELDANKCLSYHLIESKNPLPKQIADSNPGYAFGCDICQDVCPHNARKPLSQSQDFSPSKGVGGKISSLEVEHFENHPELLYGTPVKRSGSERLKMVLDS